MPPSNWWSVQNHQTGHEMSFKEFQERGLVEVEKYRMEKGWKRDSCEMIMDSEAFKRAADTYESLYKDPQRDKKAFIAPILSFHSTAFPNVVDKIIKHGYRAAGDLNPESRHYTKIGMAHGNLYGDGIYSSSSLCAAARHGVYNFGSKFFVIVNLVLPGAVKFFKHNCVYENLQPDLSTKQYKNIVERSIDDKKKESILKGPFETLAENGLEIIVSGSDDLIIPFYLLTYSVPMYETANSLNSELKAIGKDFETPTIKLNHLFDSFYTINLKNLSKELPVKTMKRRTISIFIVTMDWLNQKELCDKLQSLIGSINEEVMIFLLGKDDEFILIKSRSNLINSKSINTSLSYFNEQNSFKFVNLKKIFDNISKDFSQNTEHLILPTFVCLGKQLIDIDQGINALYNSQEAIRLQALNLNLSFIKPAKLECSSWDALMQLRSAVSTFTWGFGPIYEDVTEAAELGTFPIEKQIQKDFIDCDSTCIKLELLFVHATIDSGFIYELEMGPSPNVYTDGVVLVKFKQNIPSILVDGYLVMCKYSEKVDFKTVLKLIPKLLHGYTGEMKRTGVNYFRSRAFVLEFIQNLTQFSMKQIDEALKDEHPDINFIKDIRRTILVAAQIAGEMKAMELFNPNDLGFKWYKHLLNLKFSKNIAKRIGGGNGQAAEEAADSVLLDSEAIFPALNVRITGASQIEPWLLIIESVRLSERVSIRDFYMRNEGYSNNPGPNGYFLLKNGGGDVTESDKILFSYLFTGNPYLFQPSQPSALVCAVWVRALEELLVSFRRSRVQRDKLEMLAENVLQLMPHVNASLVPCRLTSLLKAGLIENKEWRAAIVSEKEGALSLCILLAALAQNPNLLLESQDFYKIVTMCLLQESVNRSARAYSRSQGSKFNRTDHLAKILGLASEHSNVSEMSVCIERTRGFFKLRNSNCTPFAVVACMGFLVSKCQSPSHLISLFETRTISMKSCIKSISEQVDPLKVQLALFLNGFDWKDGCDYCDAFTDPQKVIDAHVADIIDMFRRRAAAEKQREFLLKERFIAKLKEFEEQSIWHAGEPQMFRQTQIAEMNMSRPANNQLELAPGYNQFGLLKHHCCYPKCPDFLGESFKTRQGLFEHLTPDQQYYINYAPSFHLLVNSILSAAGNVGRERFGKLLMEKIGKDERLMRWLKKCPDSDNFEETIDLIYIQYTELFK